jgi:hypothetical protein
VAKKKMYKNASVSSDPVVSYYNLNISAKTFIENNMY